MFVLHDSELNGGKGLIYFIHYKFKQSYNKSMLKEPDSRLSTAGDALIPPGLWPPKSPDMNSVGHKVWKRNATTGLPNLSSKSQKCLYYMTQN